MPQMAPLSWMLLMIMFIMSIIMINSMMYFNKKYILMKTKKMKSKNIINWKW